MTHQAAHYSYRQRIVRANLVDLPDGDFIIREVRTGVVLSQHKMRPEITACKKLIRTGKYRVGDRLDLYYEGRFMLAIDIVLGTVLLSSRDNWTVIK